MSIKKEVIVVVPVYKIRLDEDEEMSLLQNLKVLAAHPFCLVHPAQLDISYYINLARENHTITSFIPMADDYFASISGYNRLMLSPDFYKLFSDFRYLLICQPDAYVFEDMLHSWCSKNLDYIGAPWINWEWAEFYARHITFVRRMWYRLGRRKFNYVGNGGFSLRKVSSAVFNLQLLARTASGFENNEDFFFSYVINSYNPFYRVASFQEALGFAFDENPSIAYDKADRKLPMACHAWPKYYESFWKQFIRKGKQD